MLPLVFRYFGNMVVLSSQGLRSWVRASLELQIFSPCFFFLDGFWIVITVLITRPCNKASSFLYFSDYAETKRPIVLRTRWKNKRKHGKKHGHIKIKHFKKLKKFMLPLLLAYKLKFFTLVPLLLGGLVLIVATTGFAGFFFALFAVGLGLKTGHHQIFILALVSPALPRI